MFLKLENEFDRKLLTPETAVRQAMQNTSNCPVILADVQDNAGAGGTSDTTGLLLALIREGTQNALLGPMCDPQIAAQAHEAGVGSIIECKLSG